MSVQNESGIQCLHIHDAKNINATLFLADQEMSLVDVKRYDAGNTKGEFDLPLFQGIMHVAIFKLEIQNVFVWASDQ